MTPLYKINQLPLDDLHKLGLYDGRELRLSADNLEALVTGRRTHLVTLRDLKAEGFRIAELDARLSVSRQPDGTLALNLHPIYKEAQQHGQLLNSEAELLKTGRITSVTKTVQAADGARTTVVEYDSDTRSFVAYDPAKVTAPQEVNGEPLTAEQKRRFMEGKVVGMHDGTQIQYRATDPKGITSNRTGLVLSVLLDGGISYLLYTGLSNLFGSSSKQLSQDTQGFEQAREAMERQESRRQEQVRQPERTMKR